MSKWEYTFYKSSVRSVGIKEISPAENLWDENGYRMRGEYTTAKARHETEQDVINLFGERGWELVSITPISFLINRNEIGQASEVMLTFRKPVE
jgi:hypothetical protein